VLPVGSLHSFVPHSLHSPTSCTTQQEHSFIPFRCTPIHSVIHLLFPTHTPTQVKRCSSVVPFCSAKTYLQGCNKLPEFMPIFIGGRPCIYRSLTSSFALQWVLTHCRSLVLLHTLSPSSLAAISSPQTLSMVFATLTMFFIGGLSLLSVNARLRVAAG
jgi:hypothetical protein